MGKWLAAFDTEHINRYVFGTNKLKEIRGASSLLDSLNRTIMSQVAQDYHAKKVYANGGAGQFLVATEQQAKEFGREVQRKYLDATGGGTSITFTSIELPEHIIDVGDENIAGEFELLQLQLQEEKQHLPDVLALASHPFMRLCDSCGIEYANAGPGSKDTARDAGEGDEQYCMSCGLKRARDSEVKNLLKRRETSKSNLSGDYLWSQIISRLLAVGYNLPQNTQRPNDFNIFRNFRGAKDYLGIVYADANNMGRAIASCHSLAARKEMADTVDNAIYTSVCTAIARHLKIADHLKPVEQQSDDLEGDVFPFDILLMGGDDVYMVVPASVAVDVALTIAETFRHETQEKHTLSVGVILAPIKYPFGVLREMAETTLSFAKKAGADARAQASRAGKKIDDDTRINFMVVTGGSSNNFTSIYNAMYQKQNEDLKQDFYATLRPYTLDNLRILLNAIGGPDGANLGRTKLYQMREAIFKMNLTTSVSDSMAILRNWHEKQRKHMVLHVYEVARRFQTRSGIPDDLALNSLRVSFPWFADEKSEKNGNEVYRTGLLDFIELYDFLSREEEMIDDEREEEVTDDEN